jgi:hypothetical protein
MPDRGHPRLVYRGHYEVTCEGDWGQTFLQADYPGGYFETSVIGHPSGLRTWSLRYPALKKELMVQPDDGGEPVPRDQYIWDFVEWSKGGGNLPFVMKCPRDGKDYLCVFKENKLSMRLVDESLRTTGLVVQQVFVRGVSFNDDGSLGEQTNTDEI